MFSPLCGLELSAECVVWAVGALRVAVLEAETGEVVSVAALAASGEHDLEDVEAPAASFHLPLDKSALVYPHLQQQNL